MAEGENKQPRYISPEEVADRLLPPEFQEKLKEQYTPGERVYIFDEGTSEYLPAKIVREVGNGERILVEEADEANAILPSTWKQKGVPIEFVYERSAVEGKKQPAASEARALPDVGRGMKFEDWKKAVKEGGFVPAPEKKEKKKKSIDLKAAADTERMLSDKDITAIKKDFSTRLGVVRNEKAADGFEIFAKKTGDWLSADDVLGDIQGGTYSPPFEGVSREQMETVFKEWLEEMKNKIAEQKEKKKIEPKAEIDREQMFPVFDGLFDAVRGKHGIAHEVIIRDAHDKKRFTKDDIIDFIRHDKFSDVSFPLGASKDDIVRGFEAWFRKKKTVIVPKPAIPREPILDEDTAVDADKELPLSDKDIAAIKKDFSTRLGVIRNEKAADGFEIFAKNNRGVWLSADDVLGDIQGGTYSPPFEGVSREQMETVFKEWLKEAKAKLPRSKKSPSKFADREEDSRFKSVEKSMETAADYPYGLSKKRPAAKQEPEIRFEEPVEFAPGAIPREPMEEEGEDSDRTQADLTPPMFDEISPKEEIYIEVDLNELKADLDAARVAYAKAKRHLESLDSITHALKFWKGKDAKERERAEAEAALHEAERAYTEARAAYVAGELIKATEEQMKLIDAQVEENLRAVGSPEKIWAKARSLYKWLGDQNVEKLTGYKAESFVGKIAMRFPSLRTATYGALLLATPFVPIADIARRGLSFVGAAGGSYDFMKAVHIATEEKKGYLQDLDHAAIAELSQEEITERLAAISARSLLDGVKIGEGRYAALSDRLNKGLKIKERNRPEKTEDDRRSAIERYFKDASGELEVRMSHYKGVKKKQQIAAVAAGAFVASGMVGRTIKGGWGWIAEKFGVSKEEAVAAVTTAEIEAVPEEKIVVTTLEKYEFRPETNVIGKNEGLSFPIYRDIQAHSEHINDFVGAREGDPEAESIRGLLSRRGGVEKLTETDLRIISGLMAKDQFNAIDKNWHTVLGVKEAGKYAVVYNEASHGFELKDATGAQAVVLEAATEKTFIHPPSEIAARAAAIAAAEETIQLPPIEPGVRGMVDTVNGNFWRVVGGATDAAGNSYHALSTGNAAEVVYVNSASSEIFDKQGFVVGRVEEGKIAFDLSKQTSPISGGLTHEDAPPRAGLERFVTPLSEKIETAQGIILFSHDASGNVNGFSFEGGKKLPLSSVTLELYGKDVNDANALVKESHGLPEKQFETQNRMAGQYLGVEKALENSQNANGPEMAYIHNEIRGRLLHIAESNRIYPSELYTEEIRAKYDIEDEDIRAIRRMADDVKEKIPIVPPAGFDRPWFIDRGLGIAALEHARVPADALGDDGLKEAGRILEVQQAKLEAAQKMIESNQGNTAMEQLLKKDLAIKEKGIEQFVKLLLNLKDADQMEPYVEQVYIDDEHWNYNKEMAKEMLRLRQQMVVSGAEKE